MTIPQPAALVARGLYPRPFRVRRNRTETADIFTLELEPVLEGDRVSFAAGQFNMLQTFGVGEVPMSVSGDPARRGVLIHTIREVGAVTEALRRLTKGKLVGVRGPFGNSWPLASAAGKDLLIVAGGIGLAPLRPVIYHALRHRADLGRLIILYGTRTPQDLLFARELEQWRGRFDVELEVTVDRATPEWRGHVGVVTRLISRAVFDPEQAVAMVCGPEIMMRFAVMELQRRGMDEEHVFLSMERSMKCGVGWCGHCQCGPTLICRDGPVYSQRDIGRWLKRREV